MLSLTCEREAHGALYVVYDPQGEVIGRIEKVPHPWDTNARGHIRALSLKDNGGQQIIRIIQELMIDISGAAVFEYAPESDIQLGAVDPKKSMFSKKYMISTSHNGSLSLQGEAKKVPKTWTLSFKGSPVLSAARIVVYSKECVHANRIKARYGDIDSEYMANRPY